MNEHANIAMHHVRHPNTMTICRKNHQFRVVVLKLIGLHPTVKGNTIQGLFMRRLTYIFIIKESGNKIVKRRHLKDLKLIIRH